MSNKQIAQKKTKALEQNQRLSKSILWKLQRNFFDRSGVEAWRAGTVPHHITCNPAIADAYARVVLGFLRDCYSAEARSQEPSAIDKQQPLYIIELGSGSGRFGYLFLKKLLNLCQKSGLKQIPVKYVMTDFTEKNLQYWQNHQWLKPFVDQQILDFALFDAERDQDLKLIRSGDVLSAETIHTPIVLIANYFFDGVPMDAFSVLDGQLYESLITVSSPQKEPDADDPAIISRAQVSYNNHVADENYYDDPAWNQILHDYKERLPGAAFLFPTSALKCIQNFHRLSGGRLLLISSDKGYSRDEEILRGRGSPTILVHGSFSMNVDYQIIGEYVKNLGGEALHPGHGHRSLNISAFLLGDVPDNYAETILAYEEAIEQFNPDDLSTLTEGIRQIFDSLTFEQIMAFLRLGHWDYRTFWECLGVIKGQIEHLEDSQKKELYVAILMVWDAYLPIGEENDLAFQLGTLLLEMDYHSEALKFLQHSIDLYGAEPGTAYNMAVCHFNLRQMEPALERVNEALELDQEFDAAKELRINIQSAFRN